MNKQEGAQASEQVPAGVADGADRVQGLAAAAEPVAETPHQKLEREFIAFQESRRRKDAETAAAVKALVPEVVAAVAKQQAKFKQEILDEVFANSGKILRMGCVQTVKAPFEGLAHVIMWPFQRRASQPVQDSAAAAPASA